jgi:hypothetical protein
MRDDLLKAMQVLGLEGDPHEAIASKLARIFSDRMTQKRELLERVSRGGDLSDLLTPEVDEQVEVPLVSHIEATPLSMVRAATGVPPGKRRRTVFIAAFVCAVLMGAGVGAYLRLRGSPAAAPDREEVASGIHDAAAVAVEVERVEAVPQPAPAPALDEYIVISIDTEPAGVKVKLDGEERGATPIDIRVRRAEKPVRVELVQAGFDTSAQEIVPDRDQRMYFALVKGQKKIVRVKSKPPKERGSGFRRFD